MDDENKQLPATFVAGLQVVPPEDVFTIVDAARESHTPRTFWELGNEIKPSDIYCYLGARFGMPNGIQNFLRNDDSSNLVHWEWFLVWPKGFITIAGLNFRTDVFIKGANFHDSDREAFVQQLKRDFASYGDGMKRIRSCLEPWIEFVNPYQRLRRAVKQLMDELEELGLNPGEDSIPNLLQSVDPQGQVPIWHARSKDYSRAIGLSFGIRSMIPVMAEAFINLVFFCRAKASVKQDKALLDGIFRLPMHIRIASLPHYCQGFKTLVDPQNKAVSDYFQLIAKRNDLLHGNISIEKLKFNELYFWKKVPIFNQYSTMWERTLGVAHRAVGMEEVRSELDIVDALVTYLLSLLEDDASENMRLFSEKFDLGIRKDTGRLGILFSDVLVDFGAMRGASEPDEDTPNTGVVGNAPAPDDAPSEDG